MISRLDYSNAVLYGLPKSTLRDLQLLMNSAARLIVKCSADTSMKPVLKRLHWLPIEHRIQFKILCLTYKGLHNQAPQYISDMLHPYIPSRTLRSSEEDNLVIPRTNLQYGARAFGSAAPKLWNKLPHSIKTATSYGSFKQQLKTHLFSIAYN